MRLIELIFAQRPPYGQVLSLEQQRYHVTIFTLAVPHTLRPVCQPNCCNCNYYQLHLFEHAIR